MQRKMRYRLGLDIGSNSIGWCMVRLDKDNHPCALIRMGVRIFPDGRNPKDGSSLAVTRRQARQMRRRRDRLLKRKQRLIQALVDLHFFPADEDARRELVLLDPYALRAKGLDEALSPEEFGRALFHLNQRRGFLSNRKTDNKESESGLIKSSIKRLRERLDEENCRTLGEWLAKRHKRNESVRARLRGTTQKDKAYDFYADRAMIEHEFDSLWAVQAALNPSLFTDKAHDTLKDILLFQRPLRPVKPGRCTLLPDEERAPQALPSVQRFRIYQEANNLKILERGMHERPLSMDERDVVVDLLEHSKAVTFAKMRKALKLPNTEFNLEDIKRDRLKGNTTSAALANKKLFGSAWHDFDEAKQEAVVEQLLNESSEATLVDWLQEETGADEATAERLANASLPEGYGNLSRKAIAQILPELKQYVVSYADAVTRAGFVTHSALSHLQQTGEFFEQLPYYGEPLQRHVAFGTGNPDDPPEVRYGKIATPTVHIGLNQLRRVVNALIRRYGHPAEIIIEVARELKLSRERKRDIQKEQSNNQKRIARHVDEACKILGLDPTLLNKGKRREISQKMRLWEELNLKDPANRRCPYTGAQISINQLLSDSVEIEHILPFAKTLDDTLNNKTVCMRSANRDKGNRTPWQAFGERTMDGYNYGAILERAALMPKAKARRFAEEGYEHWLREDKDFLARALNDTAYLSRIAREYLTLVCPTPPGAVRAIPGRLTAMLRGKFGLNSLLSHTDIKTRDDHRHHAIDAAVIAVTDQGMLQRFAAASARAREQQLDRLVEDMPTPWPRYRGHVERALGTIVVSHRPDHGYQGSIHEETAWGFRADGSATRLVRPAGGGNRQRETKHRTLIPIRSTNDPERHGVDDAGQPKPYKGYVGGSNYCIEIWRNDKGKWKGDVISTFDAYQIVRELGDKAGWAQLRNPRQSQAGQSLIMRLMINDMVRMEIDGSLRLYRVVKIGSNGQVVLAEYNEANVDARNRDKSDPFSYISKMTGALRKAKARRVTVSEIGDVRDKGFAE
jgi:CRISPR-associated endonuclease Csn1